MTMALCFNCGNTKFGALLPCPECGAGSTGNMGLDIAFSEHHMSGGSIEGFGKVIRAINQVCDDESPRAKSFIRYVSNEHSDILTMDLPPNEAAECDEVLKRAQPPKVTVEESEEARFRRETEAGGNLW